MTVFKKLSKGDDGDITPVGRLYEFIKNRTAQNTSLLNNGAAAKAALSLEGYGESPVHVGNLSTVVENFQNSLKELIANPAQYKLGDLNFSSEGHGESPYIDAAVAAGVLASDIPSYLNYKTPSAKITGANQSLVAPDNTADSFARRSASFEAYQDKDNKSAVVNAVTYNFLAPRQDEANEALFPAFTVEPDHWGFGVTARIFSVMNPVKHGISGGGSLKGFNKKNLLRAFVDPTILHMNSTQMIPVSRPETLQYLVANADVPHYLTNAIDNITFSTAPIKFGVETNYIELSNNQALIETGTLSNTDMLEPGITLENIYLKVVNGANTDVIRFNVSQLPGSTFIGAQQGQQNDQNLNFRTTSLIIHKDTKVISGGALTALAPVIAGDYSIRLSVDINGRISTEYGVTYVTASKPKIHIFRAADGSIVDTTSGVGQTIANALLAAEFIGYDVTAYRSNDNRRQRGNLLDTQWFTQFYTLNTRGPISVVRPTNADSSTDTSDLAALVTATQAYVNAQGITELFKFCDRMSYFKQILDEQGEGPDTLGVSRYMMRPVFYNPDIIDVSTHINSITSHERNADIREVILNIIRFWVYKMYVQSELQVAHNAFSGGAAPTPPVIIVTDQTISRYLMIEGDSRTIGPDFKYSLKTTPDIRMRGRMFITFGTDTPIVNGQPHPLHFGAMAWKPEVPIVLPLATRDGQISKELTVQPTFRHVINLALGTMLRFENIPETSMSNVPLIIS